MARGKRDKHPATVPGGFGIRADVQGFVKCGGDRAGDVPKKRDNTPPSPSPRANTRSSAPNGRRFAPNSRRSAPNGRRSAPNGRRLAPNSRRSAPNRRRFALNSRRFALNRRLFAMPGSVSGAAKRGGENQNGGFLGTARTGPEGWERGGGGGGGGGGGEGRPDGSRYHPPM